MVAYNKSKCVLDYLILRHILRFLSPQQQVSEINWLIDDLLKKKDHLLILIENV